MAKLEIRTILEARRTRRIAIAVVLAVVFYALLGFFAAPALIRHIAQKQIGAQLDRSASISRVALNPFTLRFEVDGLRIADRITQAADTVKPAADVKPASAADVASTAKVADAANAGGATNADSHFIEIKRLVVRPSWSSLFHLAPIIKAVQIDSPRIHVVRYDAERFNFSDLIKKFSTPSTNAAPGKPARFAVSNISINDGQIHFDDHLLRAQHVVDQFSLGIPFVATLASATDIFVTPALQARIDGSPLSIVGRTKPFSQSKVSDIQLKLDGLDLPRLASYLPASVPVQVKSGRLSTDLDVRFAITGDAPTIHIGGTADLNDFAVADHADSPVAKLRALHIAVADAEPLRSVYALDEVHLSGPAVYLSRDAKGVLNLQKLGASGASAAAAASGASGAAETTAAPPKSAPLDLSIKRLAVDDGTVTLNDASTAPHSTLGLSKLAATVDGFSTLAKTPALLSLKSAIDQGGNIDVSGDLSLATKQTHLKLALDDFALPPLQPYLPNTVPMKLTAGKLAVALPIDVDWSTPQAAINVGAGSLSLHTLTLTPTGDVAPISLASAVATVRKIDLNARTAALDGIQLTGLTLAAKRLKDGSIDLASLAGTPTKPTRPEARSISTSASTSAATSASSSASNAPSDKTAAAASKPETETSSPAEVAGTNTSTNASTGNASPNAPAWHYQLGQISLIDASADFTDQSAPRPVKLHISPLQLKVQGVSDDLHKPLSVDGQLTLNGSGSLGVRGTINPDPLKIALHVDSKSLDVATFEPYMGDAFNVALATASLNANGDVDVATKANNKAVGKSDRHTKQLASAAGSNSNNALSVRYNGDVALTNVRVVNKASGNAVAGWKSLGASGLKLLYDARETNVDVSKITFAQFYGRVLLDAQGKLNLRDVVATKPAPGKTAGQEVAVKTAPENAAAATHPTTLRIGQVVLVDGRVTYSDNFVRPNYTANLLAINGSVGAFGTRSTTPAPVDIEASLSGNGPISIKGNVNPLLDKPALDLTATARDVDLTDLTPYSSKYAGYPITKGQLNVDLHYALADSNLTANNHLFITQLTFGDRVDAPGVTHLPVRLAVSLLKNSRGEIDVNIPVSGSLSNPTFSIGSVVWHAILNLVTRAVTAPFSLLTHAFGGGGDASALQYVVFKPGSAVLTAAAQKKLDTIGSALSSKPAIKLGLTAHVDPRVDAPALRTAYVENQVKLAKLKDMGGHTANGSSDVSAVTVQANEYDKYLTAAYKAADFKKPRNFIGITKTLPTDQMEDALTENAPVDAAALNTLAKQRAAAVQDYLGKQVDKARISVMTTPLSTSMAVPAAEPASAPSPASSSAPSSAPSSASAPAAASATATDEHPEAGQGADNSGDSGAKTTAPNASTRVDFTLQ